MAAVEALILCDFAQVREGLLFISSGGITRVTALNVPANLPIHLAVMMYVPPSDVAVHELRVTCKNPTTATKTAEVIAGFQAGAANVQPGEGLYVPLAIDLRPIPFMGYGQFDIQTHVDGTVGPDLSFWIVPPAAT